MCPVLHMLLVLLLALLLVLLMRWMSSLSCRRCRLLLDQLSLVAARDHRRPSSLQ
jgi:hypothetical protein